MNAYMGIDPGKAGGIALITTIGDKESHNIFFTKMPIVGDEIDIVAIANFIRPYMRSYDITCCIEKVHSMPGQGVSSMFNFGFSAGIVNSVVAVLGISRYLITPQAWKKAVLHDTKKDKNSAVEFCNRVYPQVSLLTTSRSTKPHDGIADALCIAHYCMHHLNLGS